MGARAIRTDRMSLRPFRAGDVESYAGILAKPEVVRFLPGGEAAASRAREVAERSARAFAAMWSGEPGYGPWAAIERASDRLIGHIGLRVIPELGGETEILYLLDSTEWGRGFATEGAAAARDFGFERLGVKRLIALALPANGASLRVMEKIGMRRCDRPISAFGLSLTKFVIEAGDRRPHEDAAS